MEMTDFSKNVIKCIKRIPRGKIATYGQLAKLAGKPQGSRGVAWILHSSTVKHDLPWHRVINSQGKISFPESSEHYFKQRRLLEREGVTFKESGKISLKEFQWQPSRSLRKD